jgi:uncharacterized protein (TIGR02466 family)
MGSSAVLKRPDAAAYCDVGAERHRSGDPAGALEAYEAALALDPSNARALHLSAASLYQLGKATDALPRIEAALAQLGDKAEAWGSYGTILFALARIEAAAAAFRRGLTLDPDDGAMWFNLGLAERDLGQTDAAITALGAATLRLEISDIHHALGVTLHMAGRPEEAVESYRRALDLGAGAETALNAGAACHQLGDSVAAAKFLQQALFQDAGCVAALNNLAVIAQDAGDHRRAAELCRSAISLDPNFADAHNNLGVALQRLADTDAALCAYRAALGADPAHVAAAVNLSEALFEQGLAGEAIARCRLATIARANDVRAWLDLGAVLDRADQFDSAAEALEQAARLDGADWRAPHRLGEVRQRLGQFAAAVDEHRRACALAPHRPEAWRQLALAALRAGDGDTALASLAELLRLDPYDTEGWAYRALALRLAGQSDQADDMTSRPDLAAVIRLAPPTGYTSLEAFNRVLGAELAAVDLRAWAPRGQSVINGSQTQNDLFANATPAIQAFRARLDQAVAEFLADPGEGIRRFIPEPPHPRRYRSWSVTLKAGGYHASHVHPEGSLSGVYYVETPDDEADCGGLEFGRPGFSIPLASEPPMRVIAPRAGNLVLFPSYLWHGTQGFAARGTRTTIAFDLLR